MDFDLEQILAKVSGENTENFSTVVISDADKSQLDFALNEIFSGLTLLEWLDKKTLSDSWKIALNKLREYVFSIKDNSYVVDYLRHAVFDSKTLPLRHLASSVHANEFIQCPKNKRAELEQSAQMKIKTGKDIIQNMVSASNYQHGAKKIIKTNMNNNTNVVSNSKDYDLEYERTKK